VSDKIPDLTIVLLLPPLATNSKRLPIFFSRPFFISFNVFTRIPPHYYVYNYNTGLFQCQLKPSIIKILHISCQPLFLHFAILSRSEERRVGYAYICGLSAYT